MSTHLREAWRRLAVNSADEVPLEPGETPMPSGHVRLYHVSPLRNLDSIRSQGLTVSNARGETYGEPNMVWFSTSQDLWDPNVSEGFLMVEASLPWVDIVDRLEVIGGPSSPDTPAAFMARGGNIAVPYDIPLSNILAIHEPWHTAYRYLADYREDVRAGEYDHALDDPRYQKAIEHIKAGR